MNYCTAQAKSVLLMLVALLALKVPPYAYGADRPNFLIILADDLCWRDLGFTGNPDVHTPALDRFATQGMRLRGMVASSATCSPVRHALYTGLYPIRSGAYPNHTMVDAGTKSIFTHLNEVGYRTALLGKTHVAPRASFPYEFLDKDPDRIDLLRKFVRRKTTQPWFAVLASNDPHDGWTRGPRELYDPQDLTVPPYLQDDSATRVELRNYYAEISALDKQVDACMKMLSEEGVYDNTVVLFLSEQGNTFPHGGKWSLYDNGIRSAAVIRWPGRITQGTESDALMQYIDVAPTLLEIAGVDPRSIDTGCASPVGGTGFDGRSFLAVLDDPSRSHRDYVFAQHTGLGVVGNRDPYPSRAIRDHRYKLIKNLAPENVFYARYQHAKRSYQALQSDARLKEDARQRLERLEHRPAIELFDLEKDPFEMHNVAGNPAYADEQAKLEAALQAWMDQQGDEGMETELLAYSRQPPPRGTRGKNREKSPHIANRPLHISCEVEYGGGSGVVVAHGGKRFGYAIHLMDGVVAFTVRREGEQTTIRASGKAPSDFQVDARLNASGHITLEVDGEQVAAGEVHGLLSKQPLDGMSVGEDTGSAVGNYEPPHPLNGKVTNFKVETE